jgi:hypothetical protein
MKHKKNILKEAVALIIVMLIILSPITVIINAEKVENTRVFNDPVLELRFYQMDFNLEDNIYENTDWGSVDLFFVGQEPIMYFNLAVNGEWQIQNIPVLSSQGVDVDQIMTYYFDLGNEVGEIVTGITYGYEFTEDIIQLKPDELYTAPVEGDIVIMYGGEQPGTMPELEEAKPLVGSKATSTQKHAHKDFPNQECGKKECVPAAVSNSLKFLNTKFKLGLTDSQTSIETMKKATKWNNGAPLNWWEKKKKYMEDNKYPIKTRKITNMDKLIKEIDSGQDVEIREWWKDKNGKFCGHCSCLVGITKLKDGNYSLDVADDRKQGKSGGTKIATYIYNPKTKKLYQKGWGHSNFTCAIVECPKATRYTYHFNDTYWAVSGGWLEVYGTLDCWRLEPAIFERSYVKKCQKYHGLIPKKIGDDEINDVIFDFEWDIEYKWKEHKKWAAKEYNNDKKKWELDSVWSWVDENLNDELVLYSVGAPCGEIGEIYILVDLDEYIANPVPPQNEYLVINGLCEDLPGYLIGSTPIVFNPDVGPDENPFSTTPLEYCTLYRDGEMTLLPIPNQSPYSPEISGPPSGKPGASYEFTIVTTDPEEDNVYYNIDWGDGNTETIGPYVSGEEVTATHSWSNEGTYIIKANAEDVFSDESEWSEEFEISIPRNRISNFNFYSGLFYRFIALLPILKIILNRLG